LAARAGTKNVAAKIVIGNDLPAVVMGDALRLRAALENLADNAVKFTNQGSVVFTAAVEPAARARLRLLFTLTDSGIGMTAADMKGLFRPFAQASEQIARRYGGAGLGLTFVKRIAKAMGGDLTVVSKPGAGSTFRFSALVAPAEERRLDRARAKSVRPLSLLCAEDNPYGRVVMNTILTQLGHKIDFVESGEAVVASAARGGYDAILMDVMLSGIDGLEATRRIRALSGKAGQVTVIGISGRGEAAHQTAALAAGMNFYFVKPVSPGKLAQALASVSA
jgi:CheY-like chemotaxis protein